MLGWLLLHQVCPAPPGGVRPGKTKQQDQVNQVNQVLEANNDFFDHFNAIFDWGEDAAPAWNQPTTTTSTLPPKTQSTAPAHLHNQGRQGQQAPWSEALGHADLDQVQFGSINPKFRPVTPATTTTAPAVQQQEQVVVNKVPPPVQSQPVNPVVPEVVAPSQQQGYQGSGEGYYANYPGVSQDPGVASAPPFSAPPPPFNHQYSQYQQQYPNYPTPVFDPLHQLETQMKKADLSVFSQCFSTDGSTGLCMDTEEEAETDYSKCSLNGGRILSHLTAGGCKACCVFDAVCGEDHHQPVLNLQSPGYPQHYTAHTIKSCPIIIRPAPDVCQVKIDFLDFDVGRLGPEGQCSFDNALQVSVHQRKQGVPKFKNFCGTLSGHERPDPRRVDTPHHYFHIPDQEPATFFGGSKFEGRPPQVSLTLNTNNTVSKWNIRVSQIKCNGSELEAPQGCDQYYRER